MTTTDFDWHRHFAETHVAIVDGMVVTLTNTRMQRPGGLPVSGDWHGTVTRTTALHGSVSLYTASSPDREELVAEVAAWLAASRVARERDRVTDAYPQEERNP